MRRNAWCACVVCLVAALPARGTQRAVVRQEGGAWLIERGSLRVRVDPARAAIAVTDRRTGRTWEPGASGSVGAGDSRVIQDGFAFAATPVGSDLLLRIAITAPADGEVVVRVASEPSTRMAQHVVALASLVPHGAMPAMAVADYSNGHLYALDEEPFRAEWLDGGRLDMPWVGVCDLERGDGYALILDTPDDAVVQSLSEVTGSGRRRAPRVVWLPSKGAWAYARQFRYRFVPRGGYVALAKVYRELARKQGLLVTLAEKARRNPAVRRLFGAADVWGDASLAFARAARAAGVEHMLVHGRPTPAELRAVNDLGFLTSEYDNYTDILPVEGDAKTDPSHGRLPDDAVLNVDGSRMAAWLTYDKRTQYMKRCPALWAETARRVIPSVLREYPFLGRFIDVTTAEGLLECYDPKHPLTRAEKRRRGPELLRTVRSFGLVVGGEHGIWWGVPTQSYIEGMMSSYQFAWPAGHLIRPQSRNQTFEGPYGTDTWSNYERWGLGHASRVPLWELVFHDCVVSTWYWGDASDYLLKAAPELTPKKDAFNVLYGTIPLLWADGAGSWNSDREVFLRAYRNTCKAHEALAGREMLSHEWLTPDRAVQRTRFAGGYECTVNFGARPHTVTIAGARHVLPMNGFAVHGPGIEQYLELRGARAVTRIRRPGYVFEESGGRRLTVRRTGAGTLRVEVRGPRGEVALPVTVAAPEWDAVTSQAYEVGRDQKRLAVAGLRRRGGGLVLKVKGGDHLYDLVCRAASNAADLAVGPVRLARSGLAGRVRLMVMNAGRRGAPGATVSLYADAVEPSRLLARRRVDVPAGARRAVELPLDTRRLDGDRRLVAVARLGRGERDLCPGNDAASAAVTLPLDESRYPGRLRLTVDPGDLDRVDALVALTLPARAAGAGSVRVVACDEGGRPDPARPVPAQLDRIDGRAEVSFVARGRLPAGRPTRYGLLYAVGPADPLAPLGTLWDPRTGAVRGATYTAALREGVLGPVAAIGPDGRSIPFVRSLMFSSLETGWTEEPGTVLASRVLARGPARAVVRVSKRLRLGVEYVKTYTFAAGGFDVSAHVSRPVGIPFRAYYALDGSYRDGLGGRAAMDTQGDAEGIGARGAPPWYAVWGTGWAQSCVPISATAGLAYWDSAMRGGIGYTAAGGADLVLAYRVHGGASDAGFAERDYERVRAPVQVTVE